ncbi:hypothetical protein LPJ61_004633 [Coemansia biformis]|uniref:Uncharacterized protein n=1 Tax=Coemansia biformis TaxID=1286918 RepID=A0A9W8CV53_9FUNG|nr:hypothetical protein LPJ61_004633 [Coemansia biformis]
MLAETVVGWLAQQRWYAPAAGYAAFGDDEQQLSLSNVGIAALLLALNVGLSTWLGLGMSKSVIIAAVRCSVQLTALGMILKQVFETNNPIYIMGMAIILGVLAALEVSRWRARRRIPGLFWGVFVSILGSCLAAALFGNAFSLNMDPAYTASKFIPTIGMLFGSSLIGVSIGVDSITEKVDNERGRIESMLTFGASRWEVVQPLTADALRAALAPVITNLSVTGLISIPGVMTGWVLGGADVLQASRYQQIILFMITASTASSTLLAVLYCAYVLVDKLPVLRVDRIERTTRTPMTPARSDLALDSRTSSRMALLRAGCRPKSDMALSRNASTAVSSPSVSSVRVGAGASLPTPEAMALLKSRLSRVSGGSNPS